MWKKKRLLRPHVLVKNSKSFWMYVGRGGDHYHYRYYDSKQGQGNNNSISHTQTMSDTGPGIKQKTRNRPRHTRGLWYITSHVSGENTILYNSIIKLISTWRKIKSSLQTVCQTDKRAKCKRQNYKAD